MRRHMRCSQNFEFLTSDTEHQDARIVDVTEQEFNDTIISVYVRTLALFLSCHPADSFLTTLFRSMCISVTRGISPLFFFVMLTHTIFICSFHFQRHIIVHQHLRPVAFMTCSCVHNSRQIQNHLVTQEDCFTHDVLPFCSHKLHFSME